MRPNYKNNRQDGFSMVELMISITTMTIITGAAFALIGSSIKFASATYQITDTEQGLRTAHEIINRDLTTGGDGLKGIGTIQVPLAFVQNYLTQTPIVDPSTPSYVNLALVTSDDNIPANTAVPQSSPTATILGGTDRLTLLTSDTYFTPVTLLSGKITFSTPNTNIQITSTDIGRFQTGEIYAIVSGNSAAFGVISTVNTSTNVLTMTNGDTFGINQTGTGTPINTVIEMAESRDITIKAVANAAPCSFLRLPAATGLFVFEFLRILLSFHEIENVFNQNIAFEFCPDL